MIDADEGHDNPPLQTPQMMKCEAVAADGTTKSSRRIAELEAALQAIAGRRQWRDNLMSNVEIAISVLDK